MMSMATKYTQCTDVHIFFKNNYLSFTEIIGNSHPTALNILNINFVQLLEHFNVYFCPVLLPHNSLLIINCYLNEQTNDEDDDDDDDGDGDGEGNCYNYRTD